MKELKTLTKKCTAALRGEKGGPLVWLVVIAAAVGIVLLCIPQNKGEAITTGGQGSSAATNTDDLEQRLEAVLSTVEAAGQVRVLITYSSGPSIVPVMSVSKQENQTRDESQGESSRSTVSSSQSDTPVTVQSGEGTQPMVQVEYAPTVLGVLVIAQGADQLEVKLRLQQAVQTVLQLPVSQIEVLPMESQNK